jgi:hypothetical protein
MPALKRGPNGEANGPMIKRPDAIGCLLLLPGDSPDGGILVCTENLIHVDEVTESPKLVE